MRQATKIILASFAIVALLGGCANTSEYGNQGSIQGDEVGGGYAGPQWDTEEQERTHGSGHYWH